MNNVEIACAQFEDLTITVAEGEALDFEAISRRAQQVVRICDKRTMGGDCPAMCPMARVALAKPNQVEATIKSAFAK